MSIVDLVTFTEEILNGIPYLKKSVLCSDFCYVSILSTLFMLQCSNLQPVCPMKKEQDGYSFHPRGAFRTQSNI